ncbi:hypothetical protein B0H13DRAFT_1851957 [Mycena leptocephala]|nr:hypothetical protein B0H13DRAFT_1851957 [Mycena leptocephala]
MLGSRTVSANGRLPYFLLCSPRYTQRNAPREWIAPSACTAQVAYRPAWREWHPEHRASIKGEGVTGDSQLLSASPFTTRQVDSKLRGKRVGRRMEVRLAQSDCGDGPWPGVASRAQHPVFCEGRPAPRRQDGAKSPARSDKQGQSTLCFAKGAQRRDVRVVQEKRGKDPVADMGNQLVKLPSWVTSVTASRSTVPKMHRPAVLDPKGDAIEKALLFRLRTSRSTPLPSHWAMRVPQASRQRPTADPEHLLPSATAPCTRVRGRVCERDASGPNVYRGGPEDPAKVHLLRPRTKGHSWGRTHPTESVRTKFKRLTSVLRLTDSSSPMPANAGCNRGSQIRKIGRFGRDGFENNSEQGISLAPEEKQNPGPPQVQAGNHPLSGVGKTRPLHEDRKICETEICPPKNHWVWKEQS